MESPGRVVERIGRVGLVPLGKAPAAVLEALAVQVRSRMGLEAEPLPPLKVPACALDERRRQYDAAILIRELETIGFDRFDKMIGIVGVDLFVPIFTHVLGQAREGGKCAVISLFRLRRLPDRSPAPMSLILDRASKVAIHELGHLFELVHCMDDRCLMHFSGGLDDLDRIQLQLCEYCGRFWTDALCRTGLGRKR